MSGKENEIHWVNTMKQKLHIPEWFQKLKSMPNDPPNSVAYGYETPDAQCFTMSIPIPTERAMPFDNPQAVIDGIHHALSESQGLIEVEAGQSKSGHCYIYSVVKTLKEPTGVQYCMTMHLKYPKNAVQIQGFFDESGTTGFRDAMVYSMMSNEGLIKTTEDGIEGWSADPYDPNFKKGILMNCSENKVYDDQFPQHPLSELRRFVREIIDMN